MKYLLVLFSLYFSKAFARPGCRNFCTQAMIINSAHVSYIGEGRAQLTLKGNNFSNCVENLNVLLGGLDIKTDTSSKMEITATFEASEYSIGNYKVLLEKNGCLKRRTSEIDITTTRDELGPPKVYVTRAASPVTIFPFSYVDVEVNCLEGERAISGGFKYSTWEVRTVKSYSSGGKWIFQSYNNSSATSFGNEYFAECVK